MEEIVVATSGYFDPIHAGHIECLQLAKEGLGEEITQGKKVKLVVIVNNDKQVAIKKGKEFMPFSERLKIVKAIKYVDEVFPSIDEDASICKSLEALKPHVFAKGGDRFSYEIPEAKVCKELGIKIVDGLGAKIQSSSELVKKFNNQN